MKPETNSLANQDAPAGFAEATLLGEPHLTLTIEEIKDLAEMAGLSVNKDDLDDENKLTEIVVTACPKKGIQETDGSIVHYKHMAYYEEYPEEGVCPLGSPNAKVSDRAGDGARS